MPLARRVLVTFLALLVGLSPLTAGRADPNGRSLTLHATLCPAGMGDDPFAPACLQPPAVGFRFRVAPNGPWAASDAHGELTLALDARMTTPSRVVIEVAAPVEGAQRYDLTGFCGPAEAVANPATANPGTLELAFIFALTAPRNVACWLVLTPKWALPAGSPTPSAISSSASVLRRADVYAARRWHLHVARLASVP